MPDECRAPAPQIPTDRPTGRRGLIGLIDWIGGIDPDHPDRFRSFRARALVVLAPLGALFGIALALLQFRIEMTGAAGAHHGLVGTVRVVSPFLIAVMLALVPVLVRMTGSTRLGGGITVGALFLGLAPWPFLLFGIFSRNIIMMTALPALCAILISRRSATMTLAAVCTCFAALPLLALAGHVPLPDGTAPLDGFGQAIAATFTALGLYGVTITIMNLHEQALQEADTARMAAVDLAESDQLTGLANRRVFARTLRERSEAATADNEPFALILIDVDRFKSVNDTYGHFAGDRMLNAIGRRLSQLCEGYPDCVPARLGGDEFAVITGPHADPAVADVLAERIVSAMRVPVATDHATLYPTVSVGFAHWTPDVTGAEDLQSLADMALYASKSAGRDRCRRAEADMRAAIQERQTLIAAMREPSFVDQLEVWYQPQACLRTGRVTGLEALIRWRHPDFGLLMPASFVRHAEENDLIRTLTESVIVKAIAGAAPWIRSGQIDRLAINVSSHDLQDTDVVAVIEDTLKQESIPPSAIEIEVTESFFLWNLEATFSVLQDLGCLGVRVALDDFGTGYSSLSYLRTLPINTIKIDKSFVFDCDENPNSLAIIQAIIGLAQTLGMETVAEGIETDDQRETLARLGATRMQGYQLSRPLPADACTAFLAPSEPAPLSRSA